MLALVLGILVGCSGLPGVTSSDPTAKAPYTQPPPTPPWSPNATVAPTGHGRPYTPEMIAAVLADTPSTGLPNMLKSEFIASGFADRIWTYDGQPYREMLFGGSCSDDGSLCEVRMVGFPAYAPDREAYDHYWVSVDMRNGALITAEGRQLRGFPEEAATGIDDLARSLVPAECLAGTRLTSVAWALPPPEHAFVLTYQLGDLEGSRLTTVTIDMDTKTVLSIQDQTM